MATQEIPTEQLLLPGQTFCVGVPWERSALPTAPPSASPLPLAKPGTNTLDNDSDTTADPMAGLDIGQCQVIKRLSPDSVKSLLAMRSDRDGSSLVVMKRLELSKGSMADVLARAQWASRLRHPNLARVIGCETSDEGVFWVNEFVSGATLAEIAIACRREGKSMPLGFALAAVHEIAQGLAELHAPPGDMHGLVSDHSVVVTFEGQAKLLDVGVFRCIVGQPLWADEIASTQSYLAPEQVLHGRFPDPKTDVYALGVVLYECLTGQKMYRANSFDDRVKWHQNARVVPPSSLNVAVSPELDEVVLTALSADRSRRYASAAELALALKQATVAFMWRAGQRAMFVGDLFRTRKRREQVLQAGCGPKSSELVPVVVAAPVPVVIEMPAVVAPTPVVVLAAPKTRATPWAKLALLAVSAATLGAVLVVSPVVPIGEVMNAAQAALFPPLLRGPKDFPAEIPVAKARLEVLIEDSPVVEPEWSPFASWLGPVGIETWPQADADEVAQLIAREKAVVVAKARHRAAEPPMPSWLAPKSRSRR